ncbi:ribokinase [Gracilibacillus salitolerans]|uniref:Ribokinase n=1 Tax=Gracilibacillus salitolerans TaxID=2663022 RepID=A0A5Q2TGF0_9BACI|nr:ribokinase [Gracilibacillus salitolerans]QGH33212.1 ribokinase [Gracilibacillus salitolerans]
MNQPKITVIGSINMDLVTETDIVPVQGETVRGTNFQTIPGGKGANQAVAAARLGAEVTMIGRVGDDQFGDVLMDQLRKENIQVDHIDHVSHTPTGLANIILSEQDNRIIIIAGANGKVTKDYIEQIKAAILTSDYVLLQFEIPKETIFFSIELCHKHGIPVIVNPAPAMELDKATWEKATYITPNETERQQLFGNQHNEKLIITKGKQGVSFVEAGKEQEVSAHSVDVVDTTGAGDTFNGALAVALAEGQSLTKAVTFANAAAALSVGEIGAQGGMPTREQVEQFLEKG